MSFWKNLFGGWRQALRPSRSSPPSWARRATRGYTVKAITMMVGSEYQLAGTIEKAFDGETKTYQFVCAPTASPPRRTS